MGKGRKCGGEGGWGRGWLGDLMPQAKAFALWTLTEKVFQMVKFCTDYGAGSKDDITMFFIWNHRRGWIYTMLPTFISLIMEVPNTNICIDIQPPVETQNLQNSESLRRKCLWVIAVIFLLVLMVVG